MNEQLQEDILYNTLNTIFRHKILIITVIIIVMISIYIKLELQTPFYTAQVKLLIAGRMESGTDYYKNFYSRDILQKPSLVKSRHVMERVVESLRLYERPVDYEMKYVSKLKTFLIKEQIERIKQNWEGMETEEKRAVSFGRAVDKLLANVHASPVEDTNFFTIDVKDYNPSEAVMIANAVSRSYVIFDLEQHLAELNLKYGTKHSSVLQLQGLIEELKKNLHGRILSDIESIGPGAVKIVEQARGAVFVAASKGRTLSIAFIASVILGVMFAYIFDMLNMSIKVPGDVDKIQNISFLGSIPARKKKGELVMSGMPLPSKLKCVRSYQTVGDKIYLIMKAKNIKSFLVADAETAQETTSAVVNLAIYLSRDLHKKVLIIDANLRIPSLSNIMNISDTPGLTDIFEGKSTLEESIKDTGNNLYAIPTKKAEFSPINLLDSSFFSDLIKTVEERFDVVFINCNVDIKNYSDAVVISYYSGAVIIALHEGKDREKDVKLALVPIEEVVGPDSLYAILNNRKYAIPGILIKLT